MNWLAWLTDQLANWPTDQLTAEKFWLADKLTDWLTDWLSDWLADWLTDWLPNWLID